MKIGIDILGLQSSGSRMRDRQVLLPPPPDPLRAARRSRVRALSPRGATLRGLPEPRLGRWRALPGDLPTRRDLATAVDMDLLTRVNPDKLDVLLIPSPFEGRTVSFHRPGATTA